MTRVPKGIPDGPAFITGGSSGIGLALARRLVVDGRQVVLFARQGNVLESAVEALGPLARGVVCDVSDARAVDRGVQEAIEASGPPALAVANAGIAEPGLFLEQDRASHERQMQTNYFGALYFAQACVPMMAPGARLVFVSSGAAFFGIHGYAAYAPGKFALRGLAEVLRVELAPRGIGVTLAYPPDTDTPQLAAEARTKPAATKEITGGAGVWQPEAVAAAILRGAEKNRFAVAPGWQMTGLLYLHSLLGPLLRRWQAGIVRKHGGS